MLTFNSVGELFEAMDRSRERLGATLDNLSAADENFRESPDRWTIAEIVEHLSIVEGGIGKAIGKMVAKAEAEGAPPARADGRIPTVELSAVAERASREKFQAPEAAHPTGGVTLTDSLARLRESGDALRALRPRIEALDLSGQRFPHPAFGPLDVYHWLAVLGLHEERHRRQIEAIKGSSTQGKSVEAAAQDA